MNLLASFGIPLLCTLLTVFINVLLAQAGILPPESLQGNPPTILDVSIQLIFIASGAVISVALLRDHSIRSHGLWPAILCFAGLCIVLGTLAISMQSWSWVGPWRGWLRVWIPNLIGGLTVGVCVWKIQLSPNTEVGAAG